MGFWAEVGSFIGMLLGSTGVQMICRRCGTMCPEKSHGFCGDGKCSLFGAAKVPETGERAAEVSETDERCPQD